MTNRIALVLALFVLAIFAIDLFFVGFGLPVFLGRKTVDPIEYVAFWR